MKIHVTDNLSNGMIGILFRKYFMFVYSLVISNGVSSKLQYHHDYWWALYACVKYTFDIGRCTVDGTKYIAKPAASIAVSM